MQKNLNTNYKKKVFLIDIDNTICRTKGSNYSKSVPKKHIIKSINLLKKKGHYIKIYTARYMNRSNQDAENVNAKYYKKTFNGIDVPDGFSYDSGNNTEWETIESLRELVKIHVDPNFKA